MGEGRYWLEKLSDPVAAAEHADGEITVVPTVTQSWRVSLDEMRLADASEILRKPYTADAGD